MIRDDLVTEHTAVAVVAERHVEIVGVVVIKHEVSKVGSVVGHVGFDVNR